MGKSKALIPILLAIVIAGFGSVYVYNWLQRQTAKTVGEAGVSVGGAGMVPVAVAAVDIQWGTQLLKDMIKMVPFSGENLPEGYFGESDALVGRVAMQSIRKNVPILENLLASSDVKTGGITVVVSPGKRAVAVKGDKVLGLSGLINPGNRVDVLTTIESENPGDGGDDKIDITKVILENILVLATGAKMEYNEKGEPAPVDVYTLEVTPEEGEKLSLAATTGKLHFALRNVMDDQTILTKGETVKSVLASYRGKEPEPEPEPGIEPQIRTPKPRRRAYAPPSVTVEIYNGDQKTEKKMPY